MDDQQRMFRDVLLNVLQTSPLGSQVDIDRVLRVTLDNWGKMVRPGALDLTAFYKFLIGLPDVELMDAARVLLFLKQMEGRLGVTIRLPVLVNAIPEDKKCALLQQISSEGVHSGLTQTGRAPSRR